MNMGHNYTYRFFYKIATYLLSLACAGLFIAWVSASISRDNSRTMEVFWRSKYIQSEAHLNHSIRTNDILIDILTTQDKGVCEIYCEQIREFKLNHARRHRNEY
jgi:hypothetical protein